MGRTAVGVGLIGCGNIAHLHAAALRDLAADGVPIRAVAAADPSAANRAAVSRNFPFERHYDTADDLLADPDVDAVYVCTPTSTHRELYLSVLAAGKHLYAEKPVATDFDTVLELCCAAEASPVVTQVGFQSRQHALLHRARDIVRSGELGRPMAYAWRDDQWFPTTSIEAGSSDWRSQRDQSGGGTLLEHSIHGVDVLGWTFGPVARVAASTRRTFGFEVEDTACLQLQHDDGTLGALTSVYGGVLGREESRWEIFCERGVVEVTWGVLTEGSELSLRVHRSGEPAAALDPRTVLDEHVAASGYGRRPFFWNELASHAFFTSILSGRPACPDFTDALAAHAVVEAAYRSAALGRYVAIDEVLP